MPTMSRLAVLCVRLLVLLPLGAVRARINEAKIERDGRGIILIAEPFGFGSDGHLELTVSNLESHRSNIDPTLLGFFITSTQAEAQLELDLAQGTCALQDSNVIRILTLAQVEESMKSGQNSTSVFGLMAELVPSYKGGEWSLFFANCQKPSVVSFDITTSMYNIHNGHRDYLSVGEDMIPSVFLVSLHIQNCNKLHNNIQSTLQVVLPWHLFAT